MSHHAFNTHSFFAPQAVARPIARHALTALLAYDGLVLSDPIHEVAELRRQGKSTAALERFQAVTAGIAELEPLIDGRLIRFTALRPSFTERVRNDVLNAFGVDPEFTVFTRLVDLGAGAKELGNVGERYLCGEVAALFALFGLSSSATSTEAALVEVDNLARAIIHISFAISVCAADPYADLALRGALEEHLFRELVDQQLDEAARLAESSEETRPFERLATGAFPNIESLELSIKDALAVRNDDVFGRFREGLLKAIRQLDADLAASPRFRARAELEFRATMRELARVLGDAAPRSAVRDLLRDGPVQVAVAAVTALVPIAVSPFLPPHTAEFVPTAEAPLAAAPAVVQWLQNRRTESAGSVAVRYATTLGERTERGRLRLG